MMNNVIDYGVDGFKCDASDPYVMAYKVLGGGAVNYEGREIEYREYANLYYRDALLYPRERRAATGRPDQDATLIMGRPIDCLIKEPAHDPNDANGVGRDGFCFEYAPRDTMFSGWVGDEYGTWSGLENCLRKMVASAWRGYANFGCDIGGYRQDPDFQPGTGRTSRLFVRWTELMAFMPLMENGGGGEHRPWELENVGPDPTSNSTDDTVVDIYRKYVNILDIFLSFLTILPSFFPFFPFLSFPSFFPSFLPSFLLSLLLSFLLAFFPGTSTFTTRSFLTCTRWARTPSTPALVPWSPPRSRGHLKLPWWNAWSKTTVSSSTSNPRWKIGMEGLACV
jgi:hypothetical protein